MVNCPDCEQEHKLENWLNELKPATQSTETQKAPSVTINIGENSVRVATIPLAAIPHEKSEPEAPRSAVACENLR